MMVFGGLLKTLMGHSVFNKTVAIPIMHFEDVCTYTFLFWMVNGPALYPTKSYVKQ